MLSYTITEKTIVFVLNGEKKVFSKESHPRFAALASALMSGDEAAVLANSTITKALLDYCSKVVGFNLSEDNKLTYQGVSIPDSLNDRIFKAATAGLDPSMFMRFWSKLDSNPSYNSVRQLWSFLEHNDIALDEEGFIIAYKAVRSDFYDVHSNSFKNVPGARFSMHRNLVSDDPNTPCHQGYHVGSIKYAATFGPSDRKIVICRIHPKDVVSVPVDHNAQKMRVCAYQVLSEYTDTLPSVVSGVTWADEPEPEPHCEPGCACACSCHPTYVDRVDISEASAPMGDAIPTDPSGNIPTPADMSPTAVGNPAFATDAYKRRVFRYLGTLAASELAAYTYDWLRRYAAHVGVPGANSLPGGKTRLIAEIDKVR